MITTSMYKHKEETTKELARDTLDNKLEDSYEVTAYYEKISYVTLLETNLQ